MASCLTQRSQSSLGGAALLGCGGETAGQVPPERPLAGIVVELGPRSLRPWQIKDKGLSPKQLARELGKRFTPEQMAEIREALRKVAELMGEQPPFAF